MNKLMRVLAIVAVSLCLIVLGGIAAFFFWIYSIRQTCDMCKKTDAVGTEGTDEFQYRSHWFQTDQSQGPLIPYLVLPELPPCNGSKKHASLTTLSSKSQINDTSRNGVRDYACGTVHGYTGANHCSHHRSRSHSNHASDCAQDRCRSRIDRSPDHPCRMASHSSHLRRHSSRPASCLCSGTLRTLHMLLLPDFSYPPPSDFSRSWSDCLPGSPIDARSGLDALRAINVTSHCDHRVAVTR